jgi:hypothetical protein
MWLSVLVGVAAFTGLVFVEAHPLWRTVQMVTLWLLGFLACMAAFGLMVERRTTRKGFGTAFEWVVGLQRRGNGELHVRLGLRLPDGEQVHVLDVSLLPWTAAEMADRLKEAAVKADMANKNR